MSSIALFFLLCVLAFLGSRRWGKGVRGYEFHWAHLALCIMGLVFGSTILFVLRPNQDDVVYFHRALVRCLTFPIRF